jgi:hypothetical protein
MGRHDLADAGKALESGEIAKQRCRFPMSDNRSFDHASIVWMVRN